MKKLEKGNMRISPSGMHDRTIEELACLCHTDSLDYIRNKSAQSLL